VIGYETYAAADLDPVKENLTDEQEGTCTKAKVWGCGNI